MWVLAVLSISSGNQPAARREAASGARDRRESERRESGPPGGDGPRVSYRRNRPQPVPRCADGFLRLVVAGPFLLRERRYLRNLVRKRLGRRPAAGRTEALRLRPERRQNLRLPPRRARRIHAARRQL